MPCPALPLLLVELLPVGLLPVVSLSIGLLLVVLLPTALHSTGLLPIGPLPRKAGWGHPQRREVRSQSVQWCAWKPTAVAG